MKPNSVRTKQWRTGNSERYKAYQRELMRKRRAEAKLAAEPAKPEPDSTPPDAENRTPL